MAPWSTRFTAVGAVPTQHLIGRQRAAREPLLESLAFEELHYKEVHTVLVANVVERADAHTRELGDGLGLALQTLAQSGVIGEMGGQDLDGDVAAEARVAGAIDFTHAACDGGGDDLIGSEFGSGLQSGPCSDASGWLYWKARTGRSQGWLCRSLAGARLQARGIGDNG